MSADLHVDVLIIGGGPAGLTAAATLAPRVEGTVLVLERERDAGGIPRHSDHLGYGIRDLRRVLSGPQYARRLVRAARQAGAHIATESMVTGWAGPTSVAVTSPGGRFVVHARAVVLATGARERGRPARLIPGDRPAGVLTTGQLQNLVHVQRTAVGSVAVVVGAELVSWSAVLTLREAGVRTASMITTQPTPESYRAFTLVGKAAFRVPMATRTRVTEVIGKARVQAVEVEHLDTGRRRHIACDTIVFTGDWIPDNELARAATLDLDGGTRGPVVDAALRTSTAGVFAAGNLLHPVDTADIAALDGRHVADAVVAHLSGVAGPARGVRIRVEAPLRWISPQLITGAPDAPARGRYLAWVDELIRIPVVTVSQSGGTIASRVLPWPASPGRVFRVPASLFDRVDPGGGDVTVGVTPWRG